MAWSPPAGVVPVDRKSPSVALHADIPAMLDWLRTYYPGHTVVGTLVTARDQLTTYRVDGEPGYGTPGTLSNYTLTRVDWGRTDVDAALADLNNAVAGIPAQVDAATAPVAAAIADMQAAQAANDARQDTNDAVVSRVGTIAQVTSWLALNTPPSGAFGYESSTFRRWGAVLGALQDIDAMTYRVRQWDASKPIPRLAHRLRDGSETGAVLYEQIINVNLTTGAATDVRFEYPARFANTEGRTLWHEIDALDGGVMGLYDTLSGTAKYSSVSGYPGWLTLSGSHGLWVQAERRVITPTLALTAEMQGQIAKAPAVTALQSFDAAVGALQPTITGRHISAPLASNDNNSSTFTSWGSSIDVRPAWNYLELRVNPWDTLPATPTVRVIATDSTAAGAVLCDVELKPTLTARGGPQAVKLYLSSLINSPNPVFLRFFCNFKTGRDGVASPPATPQGVYGTTASTTNLAQTNASSQFGLYVVTGVWTAGQNEVVPSSKYRTDVNPDWDAQIILPSALYALVGRECNVYFDNVIRRWASLNNYWIDVNNTVPADPLAQDIARKGKQQAERFTITPNVATAGTWSLTLSLSYAGREIASKTSTLKITPMTAGANVTRKICQAGDSTTNSGIYMTELKALFNADPAPMRIQVIGTNPSTATGYASMLTEGYSGKTARWLYSDPASPFTFSADGSDANGTVFNFGRYLSANGFTMGADDWFGLHIGINDVFQLGDDDSVVLRAQEMISDINAMFANVQAAVPGIRCVLLETIPPSASADAHGESYGVNYNPFRYRRSRDLLVGALQAAFEGRTANRIWYAPFGAGLDTVNNMYRGAAAPANSRTAVQVARQGNYVHPDLPGYFQLADQYYAFLKGQEA